MSEIHVGDIGTTFEVTFKESGVALDISSSSSRDLVFKTPADVTKTKSGTLVTDGTDGRAKYVATSGFLDEAGYWRLQGVVTFSSSNIYRSDVKKFKVFPNL